MIVYVENPKESTKKIPMRVSEFGKVAWFLYTINEQSENIGHMGYT